MQRVAEGLEPRSGTVGPQFLLVAEVVYPPEQEESESTWAQLQSWVDGLICWRLLLGEGEAGTPACSEVGRGEGVR